MAPQVSAHHSTRGQRASIPAFNDIERRLGARGRRTNMKRATLLLSASIAVYVVAWLLPVAEGGTTLGEGGLPGWEALVIALSPLWDSGARDSWWGATLPVLSGLTNGWFLFSVAALSRRRVAPQRVLLWGSILAVLLNAYWFMAFDDASDLRVGYYMWLASFVLLAGTAYRTARASGHHATASGGLVSA